MASVITESQWKDTFDADLHRDAYHIYSNGTEGTRQLTGFYTIPNKGIPFCVRRLWSTRLNPAHLASMQNSVSACLHGAIAQSDSNGTSSAIVQAREERLGRKSMFAELDENFVSCPCKHWGGGGNQLLTCTLGPFGPCSHVVRLFSGLPGPLPAGWYS